MNEEVGSITSQLSVDGNEGNVEILNDQESPLVEEVDHTLTVPEGPFSLSPIIAKLPDNLEYTCCKSYAEHIYMGTQTGELLHYFEMETGNYLLVSRMKFDDSKERPIDKIVLLPSIERACVLSQGQLVLFLLPEFAPTPNTIKLDGINDLQVINGNKIITFSNKSATIYKVSKDSFKKLRDFPKLNSVDKALIKNKKLIVARNNNYEIFDLSNNKEIPLFKVSENEENSDAKLVPIIAEFGSNEVLVCSGGSSYEDDAMALVITLDGDISQGTIALSKYPRNIIVNFPYVLVNFNFDEVHIFKLVKNEDPILVQTIKYNNIKALKDIHLRFNKVDRVFQNTSDCNKPAIDNGKTTSQRETIIDKLRPVPILFEGSPRDNQVFGTAATTTLEYRMDREKAFIDDIVNCGTDIFLYDNYNVYQLSQKPFFMEIKEFNEYEISNIEDYIESQDDKHLNNFEKMEIKYLKLLHHLLIVLHCKIIDKDILKIWCNDMKMIDIRILLYLFDLQIFGECWCPNGLKDFIVMLKSLKIINKLDSPDSILEFLKIIKRHIVKNHSNDKAFVHFETILRTIDANTFLELTALNKDINLDDFESTSLDSIIKIIKEKNIEKHQPILLDLYIKQEMSDEVISMLKAQERYTDLLTFLIDNFTKLTDAYKKNGILKDMELIVTKCGDEKDQIRRLLKLLSDMKVDYHSLLDSIQDISLKVHILEILGVDNNQDKDFLIDFYTQKMHETIINEYLWKHFENFIQEYRDDLNYFKPNILEHLKLKVRHDSRFSTFWNYYESIDKICKESTTLKQKLHDDIMKSNKDKPDLQNILLVLFFFQYEDDSSSAKLTCKYLNDIDMLQLALNYSDFKEIDKRVSKVNLIKILTWFNGVSEVPFSTELICKCLMRHRQLYEDDKDQIVKIIQAVVPGESPVTIISPIIMSILIKRKTLLDDMTLKKMVLKSEVNRYNEILYALETENNGSIKHMDGMT
ncbi:vacuolar protein sorting-associated protein 3 [Monosporozyma servazzii]